MDIIQVLPDSVANQIAAGEVIQRPASVLKELVENAVDAGATTIQVLVVDAGRTSLQVIDDGKGMSETDARLSFERHATSKIRSADDLFALHTMGFRGEALASIAAVAEVELTTRQPDDEVGTRLTVAGSRFVGQEVCSCPVGSNFLVQNLFYNVPARRRFLKSNATELTHVITAFQRIVLVYPQISFSLHSNGVEVFNLRAGGLRQRILDVFGKRLNQDLLPVSVDTSMCKVTGFVGKPSSARKKGAHQFFFVNGRYMKHAYFHKAVQNAFDRLVPVGDQVPYFLYFEVDPELIDVNIHPVKTEIKFDNEQAIWQVLMAAVKDAVGAFNDVPAIDFDTEGRPDIPVFTPGEQAVAAPKVTYNPQYNPFHSADRQRESQVPDQWETLYQGAVGAPANEHPSLFEVEDSAPTASPSSDIIAEKSPAHYQYKGKYIMTAVKSGLMIIDQHRAHVRILYEQYMQQLNDRVSHSQKVLFPELVQLSATEQVAFQELLPDLSRMGFEFSDLGNGSMAVNAIPADMEGVRVDSLLHEMLQTAMEKGVRVRDEVHRSLALSLAQRAAIPYGQVLSNEEMENLVNNLFSCSQVNYTPDGNTVLSIMRQQEIEHLLERG